MKRRNRRIALLLLMACFFSFLWVSAGSAAPGISAQGAAVIDVESGRVLYQKQGNEKMRVASLTKIMTAIVAIEEGKLEQLVTAPDYAIGTEGSSIYLRHGEKLTLEHLLYGLMLRSGNDAAVTIADHIGGSIEGFARLMNEKAEYLGLSNTHFTNPHGLDDSKNHYSSAIDLAKLTAYALKNQDFKRIVATKVIEIPQEGEKWDRKLINKNKMLRLYEGADGVKTGYTKLAKRCLVTSATRDGRQVAVVTLNAPNDWDDHARLLDYGFQQFSSMELVKENEIVDQERNLYAVNSFSYPLTSQEAGQIRREVVLETQLKEMLPAGVSGYLYLYLEDQLIGKIGLMAGETVQHTITTPGEMNSAWNRVFSLFKVLIWGVM